MNSAKKPMNSSIGCDVSECMHHNNIKNACSLHSINVGCCGPSTTDNACTQCDSYRKK